MRPVDADELVMFPYSEGSGTEEQIAEWIEQAGLSEDDTADRAKDLCWKVIAGCINVVKTQSTLAQPNEPLTLEQLREMGGQPVWVTRLEGLSVCDTGWAVIEYVGGVIKGEFWSVLWPGSEVCDTPLESNYGKTWLAYSRPPEEEEETP